MDTNQQSKTEIYSKRAIDLLVAAFYEKLIKDENIGTIFTKIVPIHLVEHLPFTADFWESILLDHPVYKTMQWKSSMAFIKISIEKTL